jgi:hypothetical protein
MKLTEKEHLFQELREVCSSMGYLLRIEKGDFRGGHCILKLERILVINKRLSIDGRLASLARALSEMDLDSVYVKPGVRQFIEKEAKKVAVVPEQGETGA